MSAARWAACGRKYIPNRLEAAERLRAQAEDDL